MNGLERAIFGFLGTLVALAWAMHEVVHLHEMARGGAPAEVDPG